MSIPTFKVTKHVTLPLIKIGNDPVFLRLDSAITKADEVTRGRASKNEDGTEKALMSPPELAQVTDMVTGKPAQIIVNAVLGSELRKKYPNDGYVGKTFRIVKTQLQGKRYATFEITEGVLETEEVQHPTQTVASVGKKGK